MGGGKKLRLLSLLLFASIFLTVFAGNAHAVNGCASIGTPNCAAMGKECCATEGDIDYDKCVALDALCVTSCGEAVPGSGSCNPQSGTSTTDECSAIEHASCCGMADGCTWDNNGCHMEAGHYFATIACSILNNKAGGCGVFEDIQACEWVPPVCAQSSQICGASSPLNLPCCPGAGACSLVGSTWKCACPGLGGDCSSNACCPSLTCQASSKTCCYSTGGACTGDSQCCPGSTCSAGTCKTCSGQACSSASQCCAGYACEPKPKGSPTKQCCIADNSATPCDYGSQCCSGTCDNHVCQPAACAVAPTIPSYTDVTLDSYQGLVNTFTYNLSEKDYIKTGIPNALLFMVNLSDQSHIKICYMVADSTGHAQLDYDPTVPGCTDYWFIFCPDGKGTQDDADGLAAREKCLLSTKLDRDTLISPKPIACEGEPPAPKSYLDHILSHNELYFCNKVTKDYAPLCWPLMLILGLLLGASFAAGKNPFHAFDFSSPRMHRGRQYSARVQNKSFDLLSYIMGAATTAMSAKSLAKSIKSSGGFGKALAAEAKAAFNPMASLDGLKGGPTGQASLNKEVRQARRELRSAQNDQKKATTPEQKQQAAARVAAAQKRVDNAMGAIALFKDARKAEGEYKQAVRERAAAERSGDKARIDRADKRVEAAKGKLQTLYLQYVALKSSLAPSTPKAASFEDSPGKPASTTGNMSTSEQANKVEMAVSPSSQKLYIPVLERVGIGAPLTRRELRAKRKELVLERRQNVKDIKEELKTATPGQRGQVKSKLKIARTERSDARGWRLGAAEPKTVKLLKEEAEAKIKAAQASGDVVAERKAKAELSSLEQLGKTRGQHRAEKKGAIVTANTDVDQKKTALDALVKSGASEKEIANARHEYAEAKALRFRLKNWQHGDAMPTLDKQVVSTNSKNLEELGKEMKSNGVTLTEEHLADIVDGKKVVLTAEKTGKKFLIEAQGGNIVATEMWQSNAEWKQARSDGVSVAQGMTPGKARRQAISTARDIGRMPSTGTSGATASAYGARDTIGTLVSLFRKDTWNRTGRENRMAASGVDEYFKTAANANSFGQAFTMFLGFILKKMMENAKLRDRETQDGVRVQTSMNFRTVNSTITALFRVYSVMSVLSAYTKGLGAATGSSALKGGIGFMETINSAGFGSIGKYNINAATLASWVDPDLSRQMVGGGLPYPFNYLQGAVGGTVAGGAVLVQKFSDLLARDIRVSYTDGEKTFVLATEDSGNKKGVLMRDAQGNYIVGRCVGKEGQLIEGYAGQPLQISDKKLTYVVVKDGNYMQMNEREATRYNRLQADRAGTLADGNAYAIKIDSFFTKKKNSNEANAYLNLQIKTDQDIENLSKNKSAQKIVVRSSRQNALELLSRLPDMSGMTGEEQMKILNLRSTLESHAAFTDSLLGLIRGTEASSEVLKLVQAHQTKEKLSSEVSAQKEELAKLEKQKADNTLTDEGRTIMVDLEEKVRHGDMALNFFDAIKASGLDLNKDAINNINTANDKIINTMMRALDFQDSYAKCYSAAIVMGFEDRMPDISTFQQKGADALKDHDYSATLNQMADQMAVPAKVRFKSQQASEDCRKSLAGVVDAGQEYLTTQTVESKKAYADALTKNEITLLESVKFDGRFAEVQNDIVRKLDQASKQRADFIKQADEAIKTSTTTEEKESIRQDMASKMDIYIKYVDEITSTTVALHQTSDSFINAQMAKTGWQDRAPYQSSPETEALLSSTTQETKAHVQGERPSMITGHASPTWFGSSSNALYLKDAEFKVPDVDWTEGSKGFVYKETKLEKADIVKQYSYDVNEVVRSAEVKKDDANIKNFQEKLKLFNKEPSDENLKALKEVHDVMTQPLSAVETSVPEASMSKIRELGKTHIENLQNQIESGELSDKDAKQAEEIINKFKESKTTNNFTELSLASFALSSKRKTTKKLNA